MANERGLQTEFKSLVLVLVDLGEEALEDAVGHLLRQKLKS